jgi:import inner membrane translocase subunit TIM21
MVRADPRCQKLLGDSAHIAAYGESSWSRLARNRYVSHHEETDRWGTEHLRFRFYVEGPKGQGAVHVHLVKKPSQSDFEYAELGVDVKGHQRIDLISGEKNGKVAPKIFGARWW